MAAIAEKLTLPEFQAQYQRGEREFEYWRGQAIPKGMPTWIHGLLQGIIIELLKQAGYAAGAEVELRIAPDARPKPDVIGTSGDIEEPYPTKAVDVVVEVLSEDDAMTYVLEKCQAFQDWGFEYVYVVNPQTRQLFRWTGTALEVSNALTSVPATRIWEQLDAAVRRRR